ncbi:MAG: CHAT domain-containing protein [Rhizonema sp. NSF051]|nr:CHAT domain-containing protein [Rhizonema sp. NSF051]
MTEITENLNQLNSQVVKLVGEGNLQQAIIVAKQAVNLANNLQFTAHPAYCDSLNNLAELYRLQGYFLQAKSLFIEVLTVRKNLLGEEHSDVAQSLNNLATFYYSQGNYSEAEKLFSEALELWKRLLGDEHPEIATNLNNLAEIYREQGQYLKSEEKHLEVLAMRKRLFGKEHSDIIQTLNNLAVLYESQGRYSEAEKIYLEALAMVKALFGEEHPDITINLNNLAVLYDSQGRYAEAEQNYLEVLARWRKIFENKHPYIATTLNNLATNYKEQGRYLEAQQMYLDALAMRKYLFGEEHPDVAFSLSNLAKIYQEQGRYLEAEQIYLQAYSMRKCIFSSEHPNIAHSLNDLAIIYAYQGRYLESEEKYLEALAIWERFLGKNHPDIANHLNNLARLYHQQGRYSEAEKKHLQALETTINILGEEHIDIAENFNELAKTYHMQGRYSEAEQMHLKALNMRKRLLGEQHPIVAESLNNLAVLYAALFQYTHAESLFLEALKILKSLFGNEHPQIASVMDNLAIIYRYQKRYLEAEEMHLEVLRIKKSLLGEEHPDMAVNLNNLAGLYFSLGRYQEAEQKYVETLSMRKRLLGEDHPSVAQSLNNLATVLTATNRPVESLSYRIQASKINDKIISNIFAFSSESDRIAFLQKIRNNFDLFLSLVYKHLADSQSAQQAALDFVLKRKALTASALAAQNEARTRDRYAHLEDKFRQLSDLSNQIIHQTFAVPQTDNFATYQENLTQLQTQHNNLQKQLAAEVPEIQLFEQISDVSRQALRVHSRLRRETRLQRCFTAPRLRYAVAAALPPNSILVEFVRFDVFNFHAKTANAETQWQPAHYLAFILISGQPDAVQMVDLGEAQAIDDLIRLFLIQASDRTKRTLAWTTTVPQVPKLPIKPYNPTAAIKLSEALFQPIREVVLDCKHLILAPDGDLNLLPFQVLPFNETGEHLLMDEYTISYLGVGRDILRYKVQPTREAIAPLVIADPDFDLADDVKITKSTQNSTQEEFITTLGSNSLSRAPGTRLLGESVAKKLKNARLYVESEALETRLTTSQCPSIMLIATHGLFLPDSQQPHHNERNLLDMERFSSVRVENPMMRSGLALAGANTWLKNGILPKQAGKGFVFAQDIASIDLWANELTVLSACDTARGDIKIGEGVFGLRRAFAVAGSKTLVMSLWKVPDRATALLMERFFDNLQSGMNRANALQDAQIYLRKITVEELRKSASGIELLKELMGVKELSEDSKIDSQQEDTPLAHPFYWGAWICQGESEPLVKLEVLN